MKRKPSRAKLTGSNLTLCQQWCNRIAHALARYDQVEVPEGSAYLMLSDQHMFQLMTWKSWSLRYAVPVDFILITLLDYFKRYRHRSSRWLTLGITVAQLTGPRAQEIIEEKVAATFSDGENYAAQRSDMVSRITSRRLQRFPPDVSLAVSLREYRKSIQQQQQHSQTLPKQITRSWRGNPFK